MAGPALVVPIDGPRNLSRFPELALLRRGYRRAEEVQQRCRRHYAVFPTCPYMFCLRVLCAHYRVILGEVHDINDELCWETKYIAYFQYKILLTISVI